MLACDCFIVSSKNDVLSENEMRKYRLSTKYRGEKGDLADHISLSSINHYGHHQQNGGTKLDRNLNKVYIRNFYEYHHRKRPGEGVSCGRTPLTSQLHCRTVR